MKLLFAVVAFVFPSCKNVLHTRSTNVLHTCSLLVEGVGLVVKWRGLLDWDEACKVECLPCRTNGDYPWALFGLGGNRLGYDLVSLGVLAQVALGEAAMGLTGLACKNAALDQAGGHLLRHGGRCLEVGTSAGQ